MEYRKKIIQKTSKENQGKIPPLVLMASIKEKENKGIALNEEEMKFKARPLDEKSSEIAKKAIEDNKENLNEIYNREWKPKFK